MSREGYHRRNSGWQPSASQRRVLEAVSEGLTNAEIGVRLHISPETVKWHISELLAATGRSDRRALAAWWRSNQGREEGKHGVAALAGLVRFAPLLTAVLVAAVAVRLLLMASPDEPESPKVGPASKAQPSVAEQAAPLSAQFEPDAWVFDIENGTATPVPVSLWAAQWYEPGETLLAKAGKLQVIVDLQGKVLRHFGQEPEGPFISVQATSIYGEGALIWRGADATLSYYDAATQQEQTVFTVRPAAPRRYLDFRVSPDRTRVAYTQIGDEATSLVLADSDGGNAVTVLSRSANDEIWIDQWSPDGQHLLVTTGTRTDCRDNNGRDVCTLVDPSVLALDLAGKVVWRRDGRLWGAHWAGPSSILVEDRTIAESIMASRGVGGVCDTAESPPGGVATCIYTVHEGETLDAIAARFGIETSEKVLEVTPAGYLPLLGEAPELSAGQVLSIPAPLQGSLVDLASGDITVLDIDVRGLLCVSPDGNTAIVAYTKGNPYDGTARWFLVARNLQTGEMIVETQIVHGLLGCTDKSWTPDGSQVVLSSWGK